MQRKTLFRALSCVLAIVLLLGCSFAYFTDYATTQANGTAGTVALSLDSNINLLDANGQDIINPGDMRDGSFTVTNEGNKSIDVRTTIVLTTQSNTGFDLAFGGDGSTQSEYDLYLRDDVELVDGYGYMPKADAQPLQVKSIDQDVITYILPEYTLNGNSDRYDEVETVDGVTEFSHNYDLVMVMKGGATNEWQNSSVQIDVLVEAKQHENTQSGWEVVATENVTSGSINQSAVKGENVVSGVNGEKTNSGKISFTLTDSDTNTGIADVVVNLIDKADGSVVGTTISNAKGEGQFNGLAAGEYAITSSGVALDANAESIILSTNHDSSHYDHVTSVSDYASTLTGTLTNEEGGVVSGAKVYVLDANGNRAATVYSDPRGNFTAYPLTEGIYSFSIEGYKVINKDANSVTTIAGQTSHVDLTIAYSYSILERGYEFRNNLQSDAYSGVTSVVFLDGAAPTDVDTSDVSDKADGSIVMWAEGNTAYVASTDGGDIYLNPDCESMFSNTNITSIDFGNVNAEKVTTMKKMFFSNAALVTLDLGENFHAPNVTDTTAMFMNCYSLESVNLSFLNPTRLTAMREMFNSCTALQQVGDISDWGISGVTDLTNLFLSCQSLTELDLSGWDVSNVKNMTMAFAGCSNLVTLDLSGWEVTSLSLVYGGANQLFYNCPKLKTIYAQDWTAMAPENQSAILFDYDTQLVGAVSFKSSKTGFNMCNPTTGYFTAPKA